MPHLLKGESVLISSPTASGKTEAAFAPMYQRHVSFGRSHLSVVYVAPTKALVNDMYERLTTYFGATSADIIQRYTGDHHEFNDSRGKFALLCTPEALDSLQLMNPALLHGTRALIFDEIHLLHGNARGQQLRSVANRIEISARAPLDERDTFQKCAMTATVRDMDSVARVWLGNAVCISTGERWPIELDIVNVTQGCSAAIAQRLRTANYQKVIVFSNTRNSAHRLAAELKKELISDGWPVLLHIGILSRSKREQIERFMRQERRALCVATSTLEVGIDIGDVDLVILADVPTSISGFLQRIGRGNRRSETSIVWCCSRGKDDDQTFKALHDCATKGIIDDVHEYHRHSVDFQQIVSLAWRGARLGKPLTESNILARLGIPDRPRVLEDMLATGVLSNLRGAFIPSDTWMDEGDLRKLHSVLTGGFSQPFVDIHSGETIGWAAEGTPLRGEVFAGDVMTSVADSDAYGVYLRGHDKKSNRELAKLPSVRGNRTSITRQIVWSIARASGEDPRTWRRQGDRLTTWGGMTYNTLIAAVLKVGGFDDKLRVDEFGISGFKTAEINKPSQVMQVAAKKNNAQLPAKWASKFREPTRFLSAMSSSLQNDEAQRAVPFQSFKAWLKECIE